MTIPKIAFTVTWEKPPEVAKRRWGLWTRDANRTVGDYWHRVFLPRHFQRGAGGRYRYASRGRKYEAKKAWMAQAGRKVRGLPIAKRGFVPLVFTGEMERLLTRSRIIRVYPSRFTITMIGPRYVTMTPRSGRPWLAREATRITPEEEAKLTALWGRVIEEQYGRFSAQQTKRIQAA